MTKTDLLASIEAARLAKTITNDQARTASIGLGLEGDEAMLASRLLSGGADPASLEYLQTGTVSEKVQAAHVGGPGVYEPTDPDREYYLALCYLSADESAESTLRDRVLKFVWSTATVNYRKFPKSAAGFAAKELATIMALPYGLAVVGGVKMRVYDNDSGFAAAVWDKDDPQDVAAVMCGTHLMVGCPPYKPTLAEQGVVTDKPLNDRFAIVEDPAEVARIKAELGETDATK